PAVWPRITPPATVETGAVIAAMPLTTPPAVDVPTTPISPNGLACGTPPALQLAFVFHVLLAWLKEVLTASARREPPTNRATTTEAAASLNVKFSNLMM